MPPSVADVDGRLCYRRERMPARRREMAMKYRVAALLVLLTATSTSAADVSGEWLFTAQVLNDSTYARVMLKVEGDRLGGTLNELKLEGTIRGDAVVFTATRPNGQRFGDFEG